MKRTILAIALTACLVAACAAFDSAKADKAAADLQSMKQKTTDPAALAQIDALEKQLATLRADAAKIEEDAKKPSPFVQSIEGVTGLLPPPWNTLGGLAVGGVAMAFAAAKKQKPLKEKSKALDQLVEAIDYLKDSKPEFANLLASGKDALHAKMDKATIATIDEIRA